MPCLGRLRSKIEGGNNANCDSSNQQFTHGTLLCSGHRAWMSLNPYTLRRTKFIVSRASGLWLRLSEQKNGEDGSTGPPQALGGLLFGLLPPP